MSNIETPIEVFAKQWANDPRMCVHDAAILGYQVALLERTSIRRQAIKDCVRVLAEQYEGFKGLVSYHIASEVLRVEMKEKEMTPLNKSIDGGVDLGRGELTHYVD